jgi:AraC-like DNA-binding protein
VGDGRQLPEEKHHANLAHFYKLFAARFGTTPRRYRMQARLIVGRNSLGKQNSKKA